MDNPSLTLSDLIKLDDPCVIFEHTQTDSDGVVAYLYTVGGYLNGQGIWPGHTVEGDVILIHAKNREEADTLAGEGLRDTIDALRSQGVDSKPNAGIIADVSTRAARKMH